MKNKTIMIASCLLILVINGIAVSDVVLNQNFVTDPNLSAWNKLDVAETGTVSVTATAGFGLRIETANQEQWRYQGVQYKNVFTLPAEGVLIFDFYGTHQTTEYQRFNAPQWLLSAYDASADGFFGLWNRNVALKGRDNYTEDYIRWNNHIIDPIAGSTWEAFKHVIFKVDATNIKVYIENDYYENVAEPNCLATINTADVLTAGELQYGFFMYILSAEATDWYYASNNLATGSLFEGVKVTRIDPSAMANCSEVKLLGYSLASDLNKDCSVDFKDFAIMAQGWLRCIDPQDASCEQPW